MRFDNNRALAILVALVSLIFISAHGGWAAESALPISPSATPPLFSFLQPMPFTTSETKPTVAPDRLSFVVQRILSPTRLGAVALTAGFSHATNASLSRGYGGGFDGYAKRYASQSAFLASRDLVGHLAIGTLLNEDPRYRRSKKRGLWNRFGHAIASTVVSSSTGGGRRLNVSNLGGTAAAAGLSNVWHTREDRGGLETLSRFGFGLAADAVARLIAEFRGGS